MKHHALMISAFALFLMTSMCQAQTLRRWDFNKIDDREGWHVRTGARGVVMGGSLWLTLTATPKMSARYYEGIGDQIEFDQTEADTNLASSPRGLDIPATEGTQVRMRVLNLSPVTDFFLMWRAKGEDWGTTEGKDMSSLLKPPAQSKHRALQPDLKQWQEITCYIDGKWHRVIDQFAILPSPSAPQYRDDLWIDWIEIGSGPPELVRARPDVVSSGVVPKVTIPEISQAGSADAFKVLDEALIVDVPKDGFTYPFMGPGGRYGPNWWALDTSLSVVGAKWANQEYAEGVMRGFRAVQALNPDGHIVGSGLDGARGQVADLSQTPRFYEVAYDVARRTNDAALRAEIYDTVRKFLDWALSSGK